MTPTPEQYAVLIPPHHAELWEEARGSVEAKLSYSTKSLSPYDPFTRAAAEAGGALRTLARWLKPHGDAAVLVNHLAVTELEPWGDAAPPSPQRNESMVATFQGVLHLLEEDFAALPKEHRDFEEISETMSVARRKVGVCETFADWGTPLTATVTAHCARLVTMLKATAMPAAQKTAAASALQAARDAYFFLHTESVLQLYLRQADELMAAVSRLRSFLKAPSYHRGLLEAHRAHLETLALLAALEPAETAAGAPSS